MATLYCTLVTQLRYYLSIVKSKHRVWSRLEGTRNRSTEGVSAHTVTCDACDGVVLVTTQAPFLTLAVAMHFFLNMIGC